MTTISIKIDREWKEEVDKMADILWISTTALINLKLREFVDSGVINIDVYKSRKDCSEKNNKDLWTVYRA